MTTPDINVNLDFKLGTKMAGF